MCEQKSELIEKLGVHFENSFQLAPVAARILSHVILNGKAGATFEDLVTNLCASKSTISTHLNHLQDLKKIEYFTKPGDRKKYFIVNEDSIIQGIDEMMASWASQKELHIEIKNYKQSRNDLEISDESTKFDLDFHDNYIKFIDEATKSISELKAKIIEKQMQNHIQ